MDLEERAFIEFVVLDPATQLDLATHIEVSYKRRSNWTDNIKGDYIGEGDGVCHQ